MAVDLVLLAAKRQIGRAVLITGDSDFLPAVMAAKNEGVLVHLIHGTGRNAPHNLLWDAADDRTEMDMEMLNDVLRPG